MSISVYECKLLFTLFGITVTEKLMRDTHIGVHRYTYIYCTHTLYILIIFQIHFEVSMT